MTAVLLAGAGVGSLTDVETPTTTQVAGAAPSRPLIDEDRLEQGLDRARQKLLSLQDPAGFWVGELQGDSILESEYLMLKFILGQENEPELRKIANYLRSLQNEDGGWSSSAARAAPPRR